MQLTNAESSALRALQACVRAAEIEPHAAARAAPPPFVTISRQAGAGAKQLAQRLVDHLNTVAANPAHPWTSWDRELVEKVSADHHISGELIDAVTETGRSWLERLVSNFAISDHPAHPDEMAVYRRVASTVRALAEVGRVVMVGRGGMCITRDLPGGIHVRLVAPLAHRIGEIARREQLSPAAAADRVRTLDRGREQFYRDYFPGITLAPEQFSVTFNTSAVSEAEILAALAAIVLARQPVGAPRH